MTNTTTVAIVDDDESVRQSVRQLLRAADFQVLTFASAEEYLTHSDGPPVDCLIVDVNLPAMSGVALVESVATNGSRTPAILITARDDATTLDLIRRAGAIPHLRKPFNEEQLFAAMSQVLPSG